MVLKTNDTFVEEVFKLTKGEYIFKESYVKSTVKIKCHHVVCGTTYLIAPKQFLKGSRCAKCASKITGEKNRKSSEQFISDVRSVHGDEYEVLGEYINTKTKVLVKHQKCGIEYLVRPDSILRGSKCLKCTHKKYKEDNTKTTSEFSREVHSLTRGDYSLVSDYTGVKSKVTIRHNTCGFIYEVFPYLFLRGRRCPNCNSSKGEELVRMFLSDVGENFQQQVYLCELGSTTDGTKSYDFYIADKKILIEYQGHQHFRPVELFGGKKQFDKQQLNDDIKRRFAKENGYQLIEVPYTEDTYDKVAQFLANKIKKSCKAENP